MVTVQAHWACDVCLTGQRTRRQDTNSSIHLA